VQELEEQMVQILRKVVSLLALVFSDPGYKCPEGKKNTKTTEGEKSDTLQSASLEKCYHCGGTGSARDSSMIEQWMPSRYIDFGKTSFPICPVCNGTGYVCKLAARRGRFDNQTEASASHLTDTPE
jgi:hypothetical protein